MYGQRTFRPRPIGFGSGGPPPRDLMVLLGVLFFTFTLQFFESTRVLPELLRLTPLVWRLGFLWQLVTYAFVGAGGPGLLFLLELLILFWFGRDVFRYLGRRQFWTLLAWGVGSAAVCAVAVQALGALSGFSAGSFVLMQGQRIVLAVLIAAFATVYGHATIYLFFVLPIQARWFLWLEILFAFMGFLSTKDLAGFLGICVAVGLTYSMLSGRGIRRLLREWRLRLEQRLLQAKLERMKRRRGFRVVDGGGGGGSSDPDRWVH